ncbi:uncharacterized protein EI97DRAFT_97930 [Westerdykella ornata]|uniref:F-box domain-containing protein n=1 Tax=Westerdykella ornata TaxID=318751 RepID=A0A6A6JEN1_WESOR|nr:uncharacterized protein EI97DRAFT_97930 [Westerdykella ornata]KAF2274725.1 hypothetical protein EI97DRAFT_97930 [Westerdykella ornata]
MITLDALPIEILSLIASFLEHPRDVSNLSSTCRRVNHFTQLDGWKAYLKGRFGITGRDSDALSTVHGLTTLYRNWERKALVARNLRPRPTVTSLNNWGQTTWTDQSTQTIGYQPSIDSYEEIYGGWADRREVLAWAAGTRVLVRIKDTHQKANFSLDEPFRGEYDVYGHPTSWYSYGIEDAIDGVDDIMSVGLLRPHQKHESLECITTTTATGELELICFDVENRKTKTQRYTPTGGRSYLSMSPASQPLMATTAENARLRLYPVNPDCVVDSVQSSISEVEVKAPQPTSMPLTLAACNFISEDKVAVALGPSQQIVQVFDITPTGFSASPIRKIYSPSEPEYFIFAYCLLSLPKDSRAGGNSGNIFFSGANDGLVRLHDLRSHKDCEAIFGDVTNDQAIYSLALQGQERIIAGGNAHSMLKIYDIRFPGTHAYSSITLPSRPRVRKVHPPNRTRGFGDFINPKKLGDAQLVTGGWNLYLRPNNRIRGVSIGHPYQAPSSVYSLSIPSSTSPSLYAGLTGCVLGLDFVSVLDKHPDPLHAGNRLQYLDTGNVDVVRTYNPDNDVLDLSMYHQGTEGELDMSLFVQHGANNEVAEFAKSRDSAKLAGMDERWRDPAEDKWVRGQEPGMQMKGDRGHRRGGRTRRRGRGHA